jgi:hypothetical protein
MDRPIVDRLRVAASVQLSPAPVKVASQRYGPEQMDRTALPLRFAVAGRQVRGVTLHADGADQLLVLATTFPDLVFEFRSVYIGGEGITEVMISEAMTFDEGPTRFNQRRLSDASAALVFERRRALYDHLQRLQGLIAEEQLGELRIEGIDEAVRELDPAYRVPSRANVL